MIIFGVLGLIFSLTELKWSAWTPSAAGIGLGMLLPGIYIIPIAAGGILGWVWTKRFNANSETYKVPIAAGMMAGEALIMGVVVPAYNMLM